MCMYDKWHFGRNFELKNTLMINYWQRYTVLIRESIWKVAHVLRDKPWCEVQVFTDIESSIAVDSVVNRMSLWNRNHRRFIARVTCDYNLKGNFRGTSFQEEMKSANQGFSLLIDFSSDNNMCSQEQIMWPFLCSDAMISQSGVRCQVSLPKIL